MPNVTKNYGLKKPLSEEFYDVNVQNENMDIIDEQLGKCASIAVTSEVPEDTAFWIDPDDVSTEEAHVINMNNPHNVTREQIGAAPSGFGYGDKMTYIDLTSGAYSGMTLDQALNSVMETMPGYSVAQVQIYDPNGYHTAKCFGTLWKYTPNYATLEAVNYKGIKAIKCKYGGTWGNWEWENLVLLWENASPTSTFAAQTIDLDTTDYNYLVFVMAYNWNEINGAEMRWVYLRRKGYGNTIATLTVSLVPTSGNLVTAYRKATVSSDRTSITFEEGKSSAENAIPIKIYGLRGAY